MDGNFKLIRFSKSVTVDVSSIFILLDQLPAFPYKENKVETEKYIKKLQSHGYIYLILELATEQPIALIGFYANDKDSNVAYLSCLSILPEYQKKGLGQYLFNQMCFDAKNARMTRLRFEIVKDNMNAMNFYRKNGASLVGPGRDEAHLLMEKVLY